MNKGYLLLIISTLIILSKEERELKFVFSLFRHGVRAPYKNITEDSKDIFGEQWSGIKELTGVGLRQHYLLGRRNRIRYINESNLLSDTFKTREILIYATDTNRTILSVNAQMQGLYPGKGESLNPIQQEIAVPPNVNINFTEEQELLGNSTLPNNLQVFPVHTFCDKDHYIQLHDYKKCEGFKPIYESKMNSNPVSKFLSDADKEYGELFENITNGTVKKGALLNHHNAYIIFDTIIAEYYDGRNMSKFGNESDVSKLLEKATQFFTYDAFGYSNEEVDKSDYAMGHIFKDIVNWMEKRKDKNVSDISLDYPKLVLFSAHDSTVSAMQAYIKKIFPNKINETILRYPTLASFYNLELYKDCNNSTQKCDYTVEFSFKDEKLFEESLETFNKYVQANQKNESERYVFCNFKYTKVEIVEGENTFKIASIVFGVIFGILFIGDVLTCILLKKKY